jgi:uncharacterized membrane protein required for colicin V production
MFAAATQATHSGSSWYSGWSLDKVPFGWFDVALVLILVFGFYRGRKNGMTREILPMFFWVATVLVCGLCYAMVGDLYIQLSGWSRLCCYLLAYFTLMFAVYLVYLFLKKFLQPRLNGSNYFGGGEYYLGMAAGVIRYACIIFVALALLNAPYYSAADIIKNKAYAARWFGGGLDGYGGDYFPTVQSVQESVFKKSFLGSLIKEYADPMLVNSVTVVGEKSATPEGVIYMGK